MALCQCLVWVCPGAVLWQILGSGMSNKMWEGTVEHAKTCVLNGKLHVYYADEKQNIGVIFNNIFQLMGLIADGQYMSVDLLSDSEKVGHETQPLPLMPLSLVPPKGVLSWLPAPPCLSVCFRAFSFSLLFQQRSFNWDGRCVPGGVWWERRSTWTSW